MSRRSDQLRTVAQEFCKIHDEWVNDENRVVPDEIYWDGVDVLVESFAKGDIPEDCRGLAEAVASFAEEDQSFSDRDDPTSKLNPPDSFWNARQRVADELARFDHAAHARTHLPALESMAALRALNPPATDAQIALIYGLNDRYGNLMVHLVQKEIDNPGSVLKTPGAVDGRDWVHPKASKLLRDGNAVAEQQANRIAEKRKLVAKSSRKPPAETPRDIWELGLAPGATPVTVKQAAKMLQMEESEVARLFAEFEAERDAKLQSGDLADDKTQVIRELAAAGKKPKAIAEELGVEAKVVAAALKGWKPEPKGEAA